MKVFIVFAVLTATASASLIASPAIGYNAHGLGAGFSLVGGVRAIGHIGVSYGSSLSAGIVSPIGYGAGIGASIGYGAGIGSFIGYGAQHVAGLGQLQQGGARLVSSPVLASVRTITPINSVYISPVATRVAAPISSLNVHSVPLVSNVGTSNLYSTHGSGLYASGHLGKKL